MNNLFWKRTLELASFGASKVSPNPMVGALIVEGAEILAEGWHKGYGLDHAEIDAYKNFRIKFPKKTLAGCELYVNLEPCSHVGKTPPCADFIVKAGFKRVHIAMLDPNLKVNGRGIDILKNAGIEVDVLPEDSEFAMAARDLNQAFIKFISLGLPYVTLKAGLSFDGKIATRFNESKWISSDASRHDSRAIRDCSDAVVIGSSTVLLDNPNLGSSLRVILDKDLSLDLNFDVFRDNNVLVATTELASLSNRKKYSDAGVDFVILGSKRVSIVKLLEFLAKRSVQSVFVEGGASVHGSFVDAALKDGNCLDKFIFYFAPKIIGSSSSLSVVGGDGAKSLSDAFEFEKFYYEKIGPDLKITAFKNIY